jgi:hypothetical protein
LAASQDSLLSALSSNPSDENQIPVGEGVVTMARLLEGAPPLQALERADLENMIEEFSGNQENNEEITEDEEDEDLNDEAEEESNHINIPDIPENSATLLHSESTARFSGAEWFETIEGKDILIAGVGGIGSWLTLLIARLNPNSIDLYDADRVEAVNMAGQFYDVGSVGQRKVDALNTLIGNFCNYYRANSFGQEFTRGSLGSNIMLCGFDSMRARRAFYYTWKYRVSLLEENERKQCLFLDGRMSAEEFQIFCIQGDDSFSMERYEEKWLFSDSEAEQAPCSYKQTSYCANMIASFMTNLLINFITNSTNPIIPRDLPFFTSYNAITMYLKTKA